MKRKVLVVFGGKSVEHEISIISALQAIKALDKERYEAIPLYLDKDNIAYSGQGLFDLSSYPIKESKKVFQVDIIKEHGKTLLINRKGFKKKKLDFDIALPVVHGQGIEDGSLYGFFIVNNIPYIGCSVAAAAVAQDKAYMKNILASNGIDIVPYISFLADDFNNDPVTILEQIKKLGYPVIVKPASLGSSIGISSAKNDKETIAAIEAALEYDAKIIVEVKIESLKEINCAVLGTPYNNHASMLEEVRAEKDFLSFKDKYESTPDSGMAGLKRIIPAKIEKNMEEKIQKTAKEAFKILNAVGVARCDFLIDTKVGKVYFNELNTIPGSLAFYLFEKEGILFDELLDRLIEIGKNEEIKRKLLKTTYQNNAIKQVGASGKMQR